MLIGTVESEYSHDGDYTDATQPLGDHHLNAEDSQEEVRQKKKKACKNRQTHKAPSPKIPVTAIFCCRPRSNLQTIGSGRHRISTSISILAIPFPRKNSTSLMHCPICDLSQK